jgi:3-deoxy-D-manno-octulosonic-acid transferase
MTVSQDGMQRPVVPERLPLTLHAYRALSAAATPFANLLLSRRLKRGKEDVLRVNERRGETALARPRGPLVWLHGASVGELTAVIPLVERILAKDFNVLVTSGTVTSARLVEERFPASVIHQFVPLDAPPFVNRFLRHWRPDLALMVEGDLWPNLIMATEARGIPLILINGRLSERSFGRWRRLPRSIAALLRGFELCLAQSANDAARYRDLGAPRVATTGNLKLDVPEPPADPERLRELRDAIGERTVVAAASTHPGEEAAMIDAHRRLRHTFPGLLTIIAPRHVERGGAILDLAKAASLPARLRSRGELPEPDTEVYIADTMGELGLLYRVAPIVFVGGSLASHGGQNPIEPAKLGAAILHGPNVWNFHDIYAALDNGHGAEQVTDVGKLAVRMGALLKDTDARRAAVESGREIVNLLGGALDKTTAALEPYLLQIRLERRSGDA